MNEPGRLYRRVKRGQSIRIGGEATVTVTGRENDNGVLLLIVADKAVMIGEPQEEAEGNGHRRGRRYL